MNNNNSMFAIQLRESRDGSKFDMNILESQMKRILQPKQNEFDSMIAYATMHRSIAGLKQLLK